MLLLNLPWANEGSISKSLVQDLNSKFMYFIMEKHYKQLKKKLLQLLIN